MTPVSFRGRVAARPLTRPCQPSALSAVFLSGLLAGSGAAQAQTDEEPTLRAVTITGETSAPAGRLNLDTPSDTASRLGLTPRETPAAVSVVDRATIEARGAQNTQEILRAVPGVTAHDAPGNIGVSYRGFGGSSLSQLFNGINVQYSIAARPVDSWIYDRVEAIGGASSFLYGAGGVGGSINYITKLPERGDFSEARLRLGSQDLREGSVGLNRRVAGDGGGTTTYARLDLNHREADGWTDGTRARSTQLAASLLSDIGGGLSHTLAYEYQTEQVDRPYWGTPVLNPAAGDLRIDPGVRRQNYNSADGLYAQRVQWLRSLTEWRASDVLSLKNTLYVYDALRDYRNVENYRYNAANTAVIRSGVLLQRHDQQVLGNRLEALVKGHLGERASDWAFGLDVSRNRQTRFPNSLAGTVSTVDPYRFSTENFYSIAGTSPTFNPDRDNTINTVALSVENRTAILPTLHLVTALRHERIDLDLVNRRAVTPAAPASFSRSYTPTTGRVGLVWDVTPHANLYAQYATAADPPSGVLATASFADVINNSALTTGRQVEVGGKADFWERRGNATLSVYQITRQNIATQDPNNTALTLLVGEQSAQGIELAVGLQATARWAVQANLSHVRARYDNFVQGGVSLAGRTPANTPSTVVNLWTSYAFTPDLSGIAGIRHVGQVYADAANTLTWPAYTLLDLGLNYQVNKTVAVVARLRNATDKLYAANAGSTQVYLGPPRSADLSVHVAF